MIDLDDPWTECGEVGERGVTGAEVVQGKVHTEAVESFHHARGLGDVEQRHTLGDLDDEATWWQTAHRERSFNLRRESRVLELVR